MVRAIIFDCFGVIRPDLLTSAYRELGGNPEADREFIESAIRADHTGLITSSRDLMAERLGISVDQWSHALDHGVELDKQLLEYIQELRQNGYKTAVLSNASKGQIRQTIGGKVADEYFDAIIESGSLGVAKPEPQIYEYTAAQLGVTTEECVFTDDRADYCDAARQTGMQAITYLSCGQFKKELLKLLQK